ncbi:hypothetical protein BD311DRAFT_329478 [Dichomitus squalens]|uniref:Uncharacterized protein n=1 Tax=Dichomitus squalens TaxID=114155 RepID=A0A4Q9M2S7_9APHY|nr:hypothetical protein BD311DRAFT_329478 [Dichomitus squalens]
MGKTTTRWGPSECCLVYLPHSHQRSKHRNKNMDSKQEDLMNTSPIENGQTASEVEAVNDGHVNVEDEFRAPAGSSKSTAQRKHYIDPF